MLKDYSEFWISSIVAIEHTAALFYSWSIRYIVNRAPVTVPQEIPMVSRGCINFKHTDCDYNKCAGLDESLGHHPSCPYLDDENDGDYEDYDDIKEEEMQSDEDTLSTIPEEIFDGYEFDPHSHIVEHDQLNGYHNISAPAEDTSSVTNDDNIPAIITDVVNDACDH